MFLKPTRTQSFPKNDKNPEVGNCTDQFSKKHLIENENIRNENMKLINNGAVTTDWSSCSLDSAKTCLGQSSKNYFFSQLLLENFQFFSWIFMYLFSLFLNVF